MPKAPSGRGVWRYPPRENFQICRLRNAIFSTYHEICLRKIDFEYENGKKLQVTIIKITESKENKSIHRLDVCLRSKQLAYSLFLRLKSAGRFRGGVGVRQWTLVRGIFGQNKLMHFHKFYVKCGTALVALF